MTFAQGGTIQAGDYNSLAFNGNTIGEHWGVGTGPHGLGQNTAPISTLEIGNQVTAAQWTSLLQIINACLAHEGKATITPTSVTAGNLITYYNTIAAASTLAFNSTGLTGLANSDGAANTTSYTGTWGGTGSRTLVVTQSVTFASADAARYFFNAGGGIKLTYARSGGSVNTRNTGWTTLCSQSGTIRFGFNSTTQTGATGSNTILLNAANGGYWNGTGAYVTHFQKTDTTAVYYSQDYLKTDYYWSGTPSNGGYPVLNIRTTFVNGHVQVNQNTVDGTTSVSLVVSSPATTYLTNTWGTPTFSGSVTPV